MLQMMAVADWFLDRVHFLNFRDRIRGRTFILAMGISLLFHMSLGFILPIHRDNSPFLYQIMSQVSCLLALLAYTKLTGKYRTAAAIHFVVLQAHMLLVMYKSQSLHSIFLASMGTDVVVASFILGLRKAIPLVVYYALTTLVMIYWNGPYATMLPFHLDLATYANLLALSMIAAQLEMIFFSWLYHGSLQQDYARLQRERTRLFRSARTIDLSRMLGELNHHVNNPLSIIHAQLYRLAMHARKQSAQAARGELSAASYQALQKIRFMVEHLKILASPDSQEQESSISIRDLCLHILMQFQENFRLKGISLEFIDLTMNLHFSWRRHELFTILAAVIQNAGEAVENSEVKQITMRIENFQQWLVFVIKDTGPGIPNEERAQLFKPFHSTKRASQHLGLSLLSSKAMLEDRGGYIICEDVAHGCSFQIGLPLTSVGK